MGYIIATTINLSMITMGSMYMGMSPISVVIAVSESFVAGLKGEPMEQTFRPQWQNFGNACGQGGPCE